MYELNHYNKLIKAINNKIYNIIFDAYELVNFYFEIIIIISLGIFNHR